MKWIILLGLALIALSHADDAVETRWSGCWTPFHLSDNICHIDFGIEWESEDYKGCGFLNVGKEVLCKRSFAGCEQTDCFINNGEQKDYCAIHFKGRLPMRKGSNGDCPNLISRRYRCCPNNFVVQH